MKTISLKVPEPLDLELVAASRRRGISKSALCREALEAWLKTHRDEKGSALAAAADLAGALSGPEDLAADGDNMREFGN